MEHTYWDKQAPNHPLFPALEWSRPENRAYAGRLVIIGGNEHGFAAPASAFQSAHAAGIGQAKIVLPSALEKVMARFGSEAEFAPSTPSGSFSRSAVGTLTEQAAWGQGTLLAGDMGKNSETAIAMEAFVAHYTDPLIFAEDAVEFGMQRPSVFLDRPQTVLILSLARLQQIGIRARFPSPVLSTFGPVQLVETLHRLTEQHPIHIVLQHDGVTYVAGSGRVSSTRSMHSRFMNQSHYASLAAMSAVWYIQQPGKPYEALTTAQCG